MRACRTINSYMQCIFMPVEGDVLCCMAAYRNVARCIVAVLCGCLLYIHYTEVPLGRRLLSSSLDASWGGVVFSPSSSVNAFAMSTSLNGDVINK